jgi:hypothetical protein
VYDAIVLGMDTSNVDTVFIAGTLMKWKGQLVGVDLRWIGQLVVQLSWVGTYQAIDPTNGVRVDRVLSHYTSPASCRICGMRCS